MLIKYLIQAYKGKILWERIKKRYGNGYKPSRYIIFPSKDDEYNAWGLYYISHFIQQMHLDKIMIITCDDKIKDACGNIVHHNKHVIKVSPQHMMYIVRLIGLIDLSEQCTVVSVKEPYDTGAERLLGKNGVTKRDIVWYDIYQFSSEPESGPRIDISKWVHAEQFLPYYKENAFK